MNGWDPRIVQTLLGTWNSTRTYIEVRKEEKRNAKKEMQARNCKHEMRQLPQN